MELLAVKLEKKQNGSTEVYAEKKILGRVVVEDDASEVGGGITRHAGARKTRFL